MMTMIVNIGVINIITQNLDAGAYEELLQQQMHHLWMEITSISNVDQAYSPSIISFVTTLVTPSSEHPVSFHQCVKEEGCAPGPKHIKLIVLPTSNVRLLRTQNL